MRLCFLLFYLAFTTSKCSAGRYDEPTIMLDEARAFFMGKEEERPDLSAPILKNFAKVIRERDEEIESLNSALRRTNLILYNLRITEQNCFSSVNTCFPFGNSTGLRQIKTLGSKPFPVLCNNEFAGPGWLVILQNIDGKEDFDRPWEDYKSGFGSLYSNFFLGLEKIHRLTTAHRHELFIYTELLSYNTSAHYDHFEVGPEAEHYKLSSLGTMLKTNAILPGYDYMRDHIYRKFHTKDKDNYEKCAQEQRQGWWFLNMSCKIVDFYDNHRFISDRYKLIMMIRPRDD